MQRNIIADFALIGLAAGVLFAEFAPGLLGNGFTGLEAILSGPFSRARNILALQWGCFGFLLGAFTGYMRDDS